MTGLRLSSVYVYNMCTSKEEGRMKKSVITPLYNRCLNKSVRSHGLYKKKKKGRFLSYSTLWEAGPGIYFQLNGHFRYVIWVLL